MAAPLDAFALSASGSFPSERYEDFQEHKDYEDNKSILDYESIATGLKSLQRSMGWYDGRDDDNEKEDTRYIERASSTLSDSESENDVDDDEEEDEGSVWSADSFPSTIASEEFNEETRPTSREEKKKPKGRLSVMSLTSWVKKGKRSKPFAQLTKTNKSPPPITTPPALEGISRGRGGSVASSRRSRHSQQRESNVERRDSPPTIASGRRSEASKSTTRTSSTPQRSVVKNSSTRQPKHMEAESVYSSTSTAKDSRAKDRKTSKGLLSMSFGGRSKQSYKKRMSKALEKEAKESKKPPEASTDEINERPPHPVKPKEVPSKTPKPQQSSKVNEPKSVASKRSKASNKSEEPFNLKILDTQDSASWLGALADKFETWSKGEPRTSMADFEDNRLGDLRVAPKRTGTTRRLEIAEENATLDSLDRILSNDSDSLTNSMPFQLSESELESIASDSWDNDTRGTRGTRGTKGTKVTWATKDSKGTRGTRGTMGTMDTKGTLRTLRSTNAQAWKEVVECAEVIAYHGQCERLNIRQSTREKQKFRRALEVFRDHAERLKMSDRELFTAIRDDPTILNENSTFDDDETLDYLWEGLGFDDGMDRYVDAFEGLLQCGADREAPQAKKTPLISDEMSALGQQAYQRASKPKRK